MAIASGDADTRVELKQSDYDNDRVRDADDSVSPLDQLGVGLSLFSSELSDAQVLRGRKTRGRGRADDSATNAGATAESHADITFSDDSAQQQQQDDTGLASTLAEVASGHLETARSALQNLSPDASVRVGDILSWLGSTA